jgi:hypothetical protein
VAVLTGNRRIDPLEPARALDGMAVC